MGNNFCETEPDLSLIIKREAKATIDDDDDNTDIQNVPYQTQVFRNKHNLVSDDFEWYS
jgi:hypothetical protein